MTDTRITQLILEVALGAVPDVRTTQLVLEVAVPNVPELPDNPWIAQHDWADRTPGGTQPWDQDMVSLLTAGATTCLHEFELERGAMHVRRASIPPDRLTLRYYDQAGDVIPAKSASALYPNVVLGRAARLLEYENGQVYPYFYGTITSLETTDEQTKIGQMTLESPLALLANVPITLPALGGRNAGDALNHILDRAGVPAANRALDGDWTQLMPAGWGGQETTVGAALRDFVLVSSAIVSCEPRYRALISDPDYVIQVLNPDLHLADTPYVTWDAEAGDLNAPEDTTWHGETAA